MINRTEKEQTPVGLCSTGCPCKLATDGVTFFLPRPPPQNWFHLRRVRRAPDQPTNGTISKTKTKRHLFNVTGSLWSCAGGRWFPGCNLIEIKGGPNTCHGQLCGRLLSPQDLLRLLESEPNQILVLLIIHGKVCPPQSFLDGKTIPSKNGSLSVGK